MQFIENLKPILLCALQYPAYARPEYFLKKQPESGWSKTVFLQALKELCKGYRHHNAYLRSQLQPDDQNIKIEELGLSLNDESNGAITEFTTSFGKRYTSISDDVTLILMDAIEQANHLEEPPAKYSDLQIVSFFETAIGFIRNELKVQAGMEDDFLLINRTYSKKISEDSDETEKVYVLHDYYINSPKPFFDYYTFKHAVRNLLLNSPNVDKLKAMLRHTVEDVKLIINIWNDVIQPLAASGSNFVGRKSYITFTDDKSTYTATFGESFEKASKGKTHYTNYNLVKFASDAGQIVSNDVLEVEDQNPKPKKVNHHSLIDIFNSEEDFQKSIAALRTINVIDEANQNMIGNELKGVMQVWIDLLRNERRCIKPINDALLTVLLNKEFTGLNLSEKSDGKHFRNPINQRAKRKYRAKLLAIIRD